MCMANKVFVVVKFTDSYIVDIFVFKDLRDKAHMFTNFSEQKHLLCSIFQLCSPSN